MSKFQAHLVLGMFDILASYAVYQVFLSRNEIISSALSGEMKVGLQSNFSFIVLLIVVPVIHFLSLFETYIRKKRINSYANYFFVVIFLLGVASAFLLNSNLKKNILNLGYEYCAQESKMYTFSEYRVYTKNRELCGY